LSNTARLVARSTGQGDSSVDEHVVHTWGANITGFVARTSTRAFTSAALRYVDAPRRTGGSGAIARF